MSSGVIYYYWLEDLDLSGSGTLHGPVMASGKEEQPTPAVFSLAQNCPNPFNPVTEIMYDLPVDCNVRIEVYNVLGQRVTTLVDGHQNAGSKVVQCNGKDASGAGVSSGVHFYRLEAGTFTEMKKMVLLRRGLSGR